MKNLYYKFVLFLSQMIHANPRLEDGLLFVATYTASFKLLTFYMISVTLITLGYNLLDTLKDLQSRLQKELETL